MPIASDRGILLIDTHIWIWLEAGSSELGTNARQRIGRALGLGSLRLAAISLWELALLAKRGRIRLDTPTDLWLEAALREPGPIIEPLDTRVAIESVELPGAFHRDPVDRMIVATARLTGATLMTRDRLILEYAAAGHLRAIEG